MHPADIKAHLRKAGFSQSAVARKLKVSLTAVWAAIEGKSTSAHVAAHISKVVDVPVSVLWPGRYPALERAQQRRSRRVS